jgi:hypothetical protein
VKDTAGNVYQLAVGPTQTSADGGLSLSIYYAKNIASSGANTVTVTSSQTATFAERVHSEPVGQIAEDRVVTATGLYSASAVLDSSGAWVIQMVAFRAAGAHP